MLLFYVMVFDIRLWDLSKNLISMLFNLLNAYRCRIELHVKRI